MLSRSQVEVGSDKKKYFPTQAKYQKIRQEREDVSKLESTSIAKSLNAAWMVHSAVKPQAGASHSSGPYWRVKAPISVSVEHINRLQYSTISMFCSSSSTLTAQTAATTEHRPYVHYSYMPLQRVWSTAVKRVGVGVSEDGKPVDYFQKVNLQISCMSPWIRFGQPQMA